MTRNEVWSLICELKKVFDIVRLVDVTVTKQYSITDTLQIVEEPYHCYAVWKKSRRCENCISAKTLQKKTKLTKFEFVNQDIFYIVSMYVEVEKLPFVLEMVSKVTDETLFGTYGKSEFVESVSSYRKKLYVDSLTGAYNRRYYEELLQEMPGITAVAMLDADDFKLINDTFGHQAGDSALRAIVKSIAAYIRNTDAIVRYGGDEFLVVFQEITQEAFAARLELIRRAVSEIELEEYPNMRLTVSIGGMYCRENTANAVQYADKLLYKAKIHKNEVQLSGC